MRREPGIYPDPLKPLNGPLHLAADLWQAVWVSVRIPADLKPGIYDVRFYFDMYQENFPWPQPFDFHETAAVRIHVHPAVLPKQKLICTNWFYADCLSVYYHEEPWTERFWEILENYFRDLTAHRHAASLRRLAEGQFLVPPAAVDLIEILRQWQRRAAKLHPPGLGRCDALLLSAADVFPL